MSKEDRKDLPGQPLPARLTRPSSRSQSDGIGSPRVNAAGLGPTWAHTTQPGQQSSSWGIEAVVDLFVWRNKRFSWFFGAEPWRRA
jgi:hypothetical protein